MKVDILARPALEDVLNKGIPANTAIISFCDPKSKRTPIGYAPVVFPSDFEFVFIAAVHDIDIEILGDYGLTYETYFPEVNQLADFVLNAERQGLDIICQCEYGQSRSAACAAAIMEYFYGTGIKIFADYRYYPNQLIFNKVYDALKAAKCTSADYTPDVFPQDCESKPAAHDEVIS